MTPKNRGVYRYGRPHGDVRIDRRFKRRMRSKLGRAIVQLLVRLGQREQPS